MDNFKTVLGLVIGVISLAGILAGAIYYATDLKSKNDELRADLNDMSAKIAALEADLKATQSNVSAGLGAAMDSRNGLQDVLDDLNRQIAGLEVQSYEVGQRADGILAAFIDYCRVSQKFSEKAYGVHKTMHEVEQTLTAELLKVPGPRNHIVEVLLKNEERVIDAGEFIAEIEQLKVPTASLFFGEKCDVHLRPNDPPRG